MEVLEFRRALAALINKYFMEEERNTPDLVLARYLAACLRAYEDAIRQREKGKSQESCLRAYEDAVADRHALAEEGVFTRIGEVILKENP